MIPLVRTIATHVIDRVLMQHTCRPRVFPAHDVIETMQLMVKCPQPENTTQRQTVTIGDTTTTQQVSNGGNTKDEEIESLGV